MDSIRKVPKWAQGVLALIGLVLAVLLPLQGASRVTLASLAVLATIAAFLGCLYVGLAKTEPVLVGGRMSHQYPRIRNASLAAALLIVASVLGVLVIPTTRAALMDLVVPDESIVIDTLLIGQSNRSYSLRLTLRNPAAADDLLTRIEMRVMRHGGFACTDPSPLSTYRLDDQIRLLTTAEAGPVGELRGHVVELQEGQPSEYRFRAIGETIKDCRSHSEAVMLAFDTSLVIAKESYQTVEVILPDEMTVASAYDGEEEIPFYAGGDKRIRMPAMAPERPIAGVSSTVTVTMSFANSGAASYRKVGD